MKKSILVSVFLALALALTACGSASTNNNRNRTRADIKMTPELKLAVGTLKLEDTPQAVDSAAAQKLLPLWQLMIQLNSSSTTAPQETAAVVTAIQQALTPARVSAINNMNLSTQDIFSSFQQSGGGFTNGESGTNTNRFTGSAGASGGNNSSGNRRNGQGFAFGGGGFPGGGFPGGGFQTGNRANAGAGTNAQSQQSQVSQQAVANRLSNAVIEQVIQLLQTKLTAASK